MALSLGPSVTVVTPKITSKLKTSTEAPSAKAISFLPPFLDGVSALAPASPLLMGRRESLSACFTALIFSLAFPALAAILEADDDEELLERVKNDRKKRLERQFIISSSAKETGYLQELVYKLGKVGKAIENTNFAEANLLLRPSTRDDWAKNVNIAFSKLTSTPEEKSEVESFNTSLASLISSVDKHEIESSRSAFVSSASAFEKWIELTGLVGLLKGL